jgi:hypothetical protein
MQSWLCFTSLGFKPKPRPDPESRFGLAFPPILSERGCGVNQPWVEKERESRGRLGGGSYPKIRTLAKRITLIESTG